MCNFPSDTDTLHVITPRQFLDTNHLYPDRPPSSHSVCPHSFIQSRHIYCRFLKQMLSPPLCLSDCQKPRGHHHPRPIPTSESVCALCFLGATAIRQDHAWSSSELPVSTLLWAGFALHSRVRRIKPQCLASNIQSPFQQLQDLYFNV